MLCWAEESVSSITDPGSALQRHRTSPIPLNWFLEPHTSTPPRLPASSWRNQPVRQSPGRMWRTELAALGVAFLGWLCAVLTRCLALWNVSGTVDNTTATLPAYWDGVWLEWEDWDLAHDGGLHCSFYRSLLALSGSFRTWRALITAAIGAGAFAAAIGAAGVMWFPLRRQVKVVSGALFVLSGILLLVPTAWTCHHTSQPLGGAVGLRRVWGPALYLGWISLALMLAGGAFLTTRCPTRESMQQDQDQEAVHPLNRINRITLTHSQYERRPEPT